MKPILHWTSRIVLGAAVAALAGCTLAGALMTETQGPKTVKAEYVPPKEPMLVLVEGYGHSGDLAESADVVESHLTKAVQDDQIAPTISFDLLTKLRDADPDNYGKLTIDGIGRAVGAKQVLYVNLETVEIESPAGTGSVRGHLRGIVKIVDSTTGSTRWPTAPFQGQPIDVTTDWTPVAKGGTQQQIEEDIAVKTATLITDLFHDFQEEHATPPQADEFQSVLGS